MRKRSKQPAHTVSRNGGPSLFRPRRATNMPPHFVQTHVRVQLVGFRRRNKQGLKRQDSPVAKRHRSFPHPVTCFYSHILPTLQRRKFVRRTDEADTGWLLVVNFVSARGRMSRCEMMARRGHISPLFPFSFKFPPTTSIRKSVSSS